MAAFDRPLARLRRNPWILGAAGLPFALLAAAFAAVAAAEPRILPAVFQMLFVGGLMTTLAWARNWRPRLTPARVRASEAAIDIEGLGTICRAQIEGAYVVPRHGKPPLVRIRRRGLRLPVEVVPADRAEGEDLLRALGLDAERAVASFRAASRAAAYPGRSILASIGTMVALGVLVSGAVTLGVPELPLILAPLTMIALILVMVMPTRLLVGADGLAMRWLWRERFIPWSDYQGMSSSDFGFGRNKYHGLRVWLKSGEEVVLPVEQRVWGTGDTEMIAERIEQAAAVHRRGGGAGAATALTRGERSIAEWLQVLRGIGAGAVASLRTAAVPLDSLYGVLDDPKKAPAVRAAAAVALAASEDAGARQRIRIAADATAHPRLRIALERAADGAADADLGEALDDVEGDGAERARASE